MNHRRYAPAVSTAAIFSWSLAAHANLNAVPGMNEPQAAAAAAISTVCPLLNAAGGGQGLLPPTQQALFEVCRSMIQTSNEQQGSGTTTFSLQISEAALRGALQGVAGEEAATQGTGSVETAARGPLKAIGARLGALRQGATGIQIGSLRLDDSGTALDLADLIPLRGGAAGEAGSALGGFLNANYHFGDKDETSREDGFDFDNYGLVGGLDYRFSESLVAGAALNVNFTDVEVTSFPGGDTETLATGLTLYGSFYQKDTFHVDAHLNATVNGYDTTRRIFIPSANPAIPTIDTNVAADSDGTQYATGLGAGWDIRSGATTLTPYASIEYLKLRVDPYAEDATNPLSLQFEQQELKSLQTALGVQLSHSISTQSGVLQPQGHVAWIHEFENDSRSLIARYVNDPFNASTFAVPTNDPDRDYFTLGAGVAATFAQGLMGFFNIEAVAGLDEVTNIGLLGGVRGEW